MMAHRGLILTAVILPTLGSYVPSAVARASLTSSDPVWNSDHISRLPEEIRKALTRLCGESARGAHYFATYSDNSKLINLHFEHFQCRGQPTLCTQAGCLHQVYGRSGGRYRLLRSYYGPNND